MSSNNTTNRYDKYKDSGIEWIGEIPDSWKLVKTGRIFRNIKEIVGEKSMLVERFALTLNGVIKRSKSDAEGLQPEQFNGYQYLRKNQLVFKLIDLENVNTSRVGLCEFEEGMVSPAYIVLCNNNLNNRYYYYYFISLWHNEIFNHLGGDGVRSALNAKDLLAIPTFDISIKEQEAIAGYLDQKCGAIDETIEKQKSVIEKLKEYKQSIITQAVTKGLDKSAPMKDSGIEWIGQIPQHWEICKLLKLFKDRKCPNKGNVENNVLSLSYGNIKRRNVETNMGLLPESFESYNIIEPDNIVLRLTDLQNDHKSLRCGLVKERGIITSAYVTLELKDTSQCANYFYRLLHTFDIEKGFYGMGAGVRQSLKYDGELCNLYIIKPPVIEQKHIAEFLDKKCSEIDKTIEDKEKLIEKLVEYKKSLIYECVTGKRKVLA